MRPRAFDRLLVGCALAASALAAAAQTAPTPAPAGTCRVLDPELQGRYEGGCRDGLADGEGVAIGATAEYRGAFRAGMKHGRGVKTWTWFGDRYEGEFVDDRREGQGRYLWGPRGPWAGEVYEGGYVADRRHGTGTYTWSTGDRYTGPFENDLQAGVQTPLQAQRTRAIKAHLAVLGKPGTVVCGRTKLGIAHEQELRAEVIEVVQDRVRLRTVAIGGRPVQATDVSFWDLVLHWRPCR